MKTLGSVAGVVASIREDAAAETERLEREAARAIDAVSKDQPDAAARPEHVARVVAARRRAEDDEADEEWKSSLEDLQDRERWMMAVIDQGRAVAEGRAARDVQSWIRALVVEAVAGLPPGACVIVVATPLVPLLDHAWCDETAKAAGRQVSIEGGAVTAGCIVRIADRPLAYDNSLEARERRTEVQWRAALARVYADAVSQASSPSDTELRKEPASELSV